VQHGCCRCLLTLVAEVTYEHILSRRQLAVLLARLYPYIVDDAAVLAAAAALHAVPSSLPVAPPAEQQSEATLTVPPAEAPGSAALHVAGSGLRGAGVSAAVSHGHTPLPTSAVGSGTNRAATGNLDTHPSTRNLAALGGAPSDTELEAAAQCEGGNWPV
jgi:hypothetical protein